MADLTVLSADPLPDVPTAEVQAQLAFELAANLSDESSLLERYALTRGQLQRLLEHPGFRNMVEEARVAWAADTNAKERVRLKAGFVVEDALAVIYDIIHDARATPQARIEAFKQAVAVADMGPKKDGGEEGSRFSVTINLPGQAPMAIEAESHRTYDNDE